MSVNPLVQHQHHVAVEELEALEIDRRTNQTVHADCVREDVPEIARIDVHLDERPARHGPGQALLQGVVARQPQQFAFAQQIGARVADVGEEHVGAGAERGGERRLRPRVAESQLRHGAVDVPVETARRGP
jgi:hypothetical protein